MLSSIKDFKLTSFYSNKATHLKATHLKDIHLKIIHLRDIHLKVTLKRNQFMFNKHQPKRKVIVTPAWSACCVAVSLKCVATSFDHIHLISVVSTKTWFVQVTDLLHYRMILIQNKNLLLYILLVS